MLNVYNKCHMFSNDRYLLRFVKIEDCDDLLKVYSDKKAVPYFNSDNCGGDDFYYTTNARMKQAIEYWHWEYSRKGFVRWAIVDKSIDKAIGTIELFHRNADDYFANCGLLCLDLRSCYEKQAEIHEILSLIVFQAFKLFHCDIIAKKAIPDAVERVKALIKLGVYEKSECLVGHDNTCYNNYFVLKKP